MPSPDRLAAAYERQSLAVIDTVRARVEQVWLASPNYRDADVARIIRQIVPLVEGGQIQLANLTNAYVIATADAIGVPARVVPIDRAGVLDPRGVPKVEVYQRPANEVYTQLAKGESMTRAVEVGTQRLASIVSTDLQLARRGQASKALAGTGFRYYIRVLTGRENCALCAIASTQRYNVENLMPIHPGCDCGVRPVDAAYDPGQVVDQGLLDEIHTLAAERLGASDPNARYAGLGKSVTYSDSRSRAPNPQERLADYTELVVTREHGEYGPTLTWRDHAFTGPSAFDGLD